MSIVKDVDSAFMAAFKAKETDKVGALRLLKAALKNRSIELIKPELSDEEAVALIRSEVKKRRDSIEAYLAGQRQDLADMEKAEIVILESFLPPELTEEEVRKIAVAAIAELPEAERKNFGKAMGAAMKQLKGKADSGLVSRVIKELTA